MKPIHNYAFEYKLIIHIQGNHCVTIDLRNCSLFLPLQSTKIFNKSNNGIVFIILFRKKVRSYQLSSDLIFFRFILQTTAPLLQHKVLSEKFMQTEKVLHLDVFDTLSLNLINMAPFRVYSVLVDLGQKEV